MVVQKDTYASQRTSKNHSESWAKGLVGLRAGFLNSGQTAAPSTPTFSGLREAWLVRRGSVHFKWDTWSNLQHARILPENRGQSQEATVPRSHDSELPEMGIWFTVWFCTWFFLTLWGIILSVTIISLHDWVTGCHKLKQKTPESTFVSFRHLYSCIGNRSWPEALSL